MRRNLLPTWQELKQEGLVYLSEESGKEVLSRDKFDLLLHILRKEYGLAYILPNDIRQNEITQKDYDSVLLRITDSFSFSHYQYEEEAEDWEIRRRIVRRIK